MHVIYHLRIQYWLGWFWVVKSLDGVGDVGLMIIGV